MASTVYVDFSTETPVVAAWLNDVNSVAYGIGSTAGMLLQSNGVGNVPTYTANPTVNQLSAFQYTSTGGFIIPTSTVGIRGTLTNDSPAAGAVGEEFVGTLAAVPLATNVSNNAAFVDVSPGDYIVWGVAGFVPAATTTVSALNAGISLVSGTLGAFGTATVSVLPFTTGGPQTFPTPMCHVKVPAGPPQRLFLVATATFGVSTMTVTGNIHAIRIR